MPLLNIQTNVDLEKATADALIRTASARIANALGKPERYVMVGIEAGRTMCFGGSCERLAYLELKSIDLPEDQIAELSRLLTELIHGAIDVPTDRVYIEFTSAPRGMWGWNGGTF